MERGRPRTRLSAEPAEWSGARRAHTVLTRHGGRTVGGLITDGRRRPEDAMKGLRLPELEFGDQSGRKVSSFGTRQDRGV